MKKLFIILFLLTVSFRVAAQNEQTKDSTLLNRFPTEMGKEPLSPPPGTAAAPNRDMSVKTSLSTDIRMGKMVSSYDPFVMDYEHYGAFQLSPNSILSTFSTYNTYPTMGTIIQSGADFIYRPNERWELTGGMYTAKYTIPSRMHGSQFDIGLDASAAYRINNFLRIRFFRQYSGFGKQNSLNGYMNPMYPQSHYGVVMEVKINDYLEIQGGVERAYNASKMKWETVPILAPVIHLNRKKK